MWAVFYSREGRMTMLDRRFGFVVLVAVAAAPALAQQYEVRAPSGMAHEMDKASLDVLRTKVPGYVDMTDAEINASMGRMPPDWTWYGSTSSVRDNLGVLVVAHGSGTSGDKVLQEGVAPIAAKHPTAIGFGMAMMSSHHIQEALDKLTNAGAKTIVVVPAVKVPACFLFASKAIFPTTYPLPSSLSLS